MSDEANNHNGSRPLTEDFRNELVALQTRLQAEDNDDAVEEVIKAIPSVLKHVSNHHYSSTDESDGGVTLTTALYEVYVTALLHQNKFSESLQQIEKAATAAASASGSSSHRLQLLKAYVQYREHEYAACRDACEKLLKQNGSSSHEDDEATRHLLAQSLYHLQEPAAAVDLYEQELSKTDDADTDVWTNLTAVLQSQETPYQSTAVAALLSNSSTKLLQDINEYLSNNNGNDDEFAHDLAFNFATLQLLTESNSAQQLLFQAEAAAEEDDVASIRTNAAWSRALWSGTAVPVTTSSQKKKKAKDSAAPATSPLSAVQQIHQALSLGTATTATAALEQYPATPHVKFTPLQKRLWCYNRAVLLLQAGEFQASLDLCDVLWNGLQPLSNTKKKKLAAAVTAQQANGNDNASWADIMVVPLQDNPQALLWWEVRLTVLKAYCQHGKPGIKPAARQQALDAISQLQSKLAAEQDLQCADQLVCYCQVHAAHLRQKQREQVDDNNDDKNETTSALQLLQDGLPASVQTKPAVLATTAALYQAAGQAEQAAAVLESTGNGAAVRADFAMARHDYAQAATLYQQQLEQQQQTDADKNQEVMTTAQWVQALSYTDPEKAMEVWSNAINSHPELLENNDDTAVDAAELEVRQLPRLTTRRSTQGVGSSTTASAPATSADGTSTTPRKSHDAVMRRRSRQREQHLAKLSAAGLYRADRPTVPDPERWLPKYERAWARRRQYRRGGANNRQQHRGAQGGVSVQDAAKLDVAARQAARATGELDASKSTAHMTVSSGGMVSRKGGKGRR